MSEQKKKYKAQTFKKMKDEITKIDSQTYYVRGSQPEPYLVFHSINQNKWFCDCMAFTLNIKDDGTTKDCKHIKKINSLFSTP